MPQYFYTFIKDIFLVKNSNIFVNRHCSKLLFCIIMQNKEKISSIVLIRQISVAKHYVKEGELFPIIYCRVKF